jgi:hypothetical protein
METLIRNTITRNRRLVNTRRPVFPAFFSILKRRVPEKKPVASDCKHLMFKMSLKGDWLPTLWELHEFAPQFFLFS